MAKQNGNGGGGTPKSKRQALPPRRARKDESVPDWSELGDLFLSFGYAMRDGKQRLETRGYHSQADLLMTWDGLVLEDLFEWIAEQTRAFLPPVLPPVLPDVLPDILPIATQEVAVVPSIPASVAPGTVINDQSNPEGYLEVRANADASDESLESFTVRIVGLTLSEVAVPVAASLAANLPGSPPVLRASGWLQIDPASEQEWRRFPYRVELFLLNGEQANEGLQESQELQANEELTDDDARRGKQTTSATYDGSFQPDEFTQYLEVEFPAPAVGDYRLKAVVTLLPSGKIVGQARGPALRVE